MSKEFFKDDPEKSLKNKNIALFLMVSDVTGGGGVERLYLNFVMLNKKNNAGRIDILTTKKSRDHIMTLYQDFPKECIKIIPVLNNRFSIYASKLGIFFHFLLNRYKLVHIANYDYYFSVVYKYISRWTKLTLNIIDCRFSPEFQNDRYQSIKEFISSTALSGVYSWYENTQEAITLLNPKLYFKAATICFTNYDVFIPGKKEKEIIFAARLSVFKRPDHYLQAIEICLKNNPALFESYTFLLWGDGDLKDELVHRINKAGLSEKIKVGFSKDMSVYFNKTSIFVSTQMYENFTSLSMLEAMASGNAIISYDVGQSNLFVKDKQNGLLVKSENPESLAIAMEELVKSPEILEAMQKESFKLAKEVHTYENFRNEINTFWSCVLNLKTSS